MGENRDVPDGFLERVTDALLPFWPGIAVTLFVGGSVMFGTIISMAEYASMTIDQINDAMGRAGLKAQEPDNDMNLGQNGDIIEEDERFVHLRSVTIVAPGGNEFWAETVRLRLAQVKGWSLGAPSMRPVA